MHPHGLLTPGAILALASPFKGVVLSILVIVVIFLIILIMIKRSYRVAEPNEALIITGGGGHGGGNATEGLDFKIVTGRGVLVMPLFQKVRILPLGLHETELVVNCVSTQAIRVDVTAVVVFKIGDGKESIANAARRFLGQEEKMDSQVHKVFAGHLRSIVGGMTVEDIIRQREELTKQTRESASVEMDKLGLLIDSLQIEEIVDSNGYIDNLGKPETARVESAARVAQAEANQTATAREQEADAANAEVQRDTKIKKAGFDAEVQEAQATADQAGPLAKAEAEQGVIQKQTEVATLQAARTEQELQTSTVKPAEAEANATRIRAEAERDASLAGTTAEAAKTKQVGEAEADADKARGLAKAEVLRAQGEAEGAALKARADGLASQADAVMGQQFIDKLPEIVAAVAQPLSAVDHMVVLDGATGLTGTISDIISQGLALWPMFRNSFTATTSSDGKSPSATAAVGSPSDVSTDGAVPAAAGTGDGGGDDARD
jgi:uncharacterized membrane protein YqiK